MKRLLSAAVFGFLATAMGAFLNRAGKTKRAENSRFFNFTVRPGQGKPIATAGKVPGKSRNLVHKKRLSIRSMYAQNEKDHLSRLAGGHDRFRQAAEIR
jgi:hypothetical protein